MKKEDYKKHVKGFSLLNCTIVDNDFFTFMAQEIPSTGFDSSDDAYDYRTRAISINRGEVGSITWNSGLKHPKIIRIESKGYLVSSWEGRMKETNQLPHKFPQYTLEKKEFMGEFNKGITINQLRKIDGEIYAVGTHHKLFKRVGKKKWIDLTNEKIHDELFREIKLVRENKYKGNLASTFHSVDGFDKKNIYAVGWQGDAWFYNGETWLALEPPINESFHKVICGSDGFVYIISNWGSILKLTHDGNLLNEKWEIIPRGFVSKDVGLQDATWFENKLYLSNFTGLYFLDGYEVKNVDFMGQIDITKVAFKNVTSGHGVLVSYALESAIVFNGESWKYIIPSFD